MHAKGLEGFTMLSANLKINPEVCSVSKSDHPPFIHHQQDENYYCPILNTALNNASP